MVALVLAAPAECRRAARDAPLTTSRGTGTAAIAQTAKVPDRVSKRVLFLISDTGGGHRAGAQAIGAALDEIGDGTEFTWRIEDIAAHCTFPLSKLGPAYSAALRYAPPLYGALYHATNGRRRYRAIVRWCETALPRTPARRLRRLQSGRHRFGSSAAQPRRIARPRRSGISDVPIVASTDLGRVHEGWLLPEADLTIVPAREVYLRALERGVPPDRLRLCGHDPSEV